MEKAHADAIAQAILEPDLRVQEEVRRKRAKKAANLLRKRRVAWIVLIGSAIGAAIAYSSGIHFSLGVIWGGVAGSALGWITTHRAAA